MKTIKLEKRDVEICTSLNEITISQFEKCVEIFKKEYSSSMDQYIDILQVLSNMSIDEIEELELDVFEDMVAGININDMSEYNTTFKNEIIINGITFKSKSDGKSYKFTVKEIFLLKDLIAINPYDYISDLVAIVFKHVDEEGNIINDLTPEGIKQRKEELVNVKMDVISAYLVSLSEYFIPK